MSATYEKQNRKVSVYEYAYATGRIRALENTLMDSGDFSRILDARTEEEIEKILSENGYKSGKNFRESIDNDLTDTFLLVEAMVPDRSLVEIIKLENDYHNIKVILKSVIPHLPDKIFESDYQTESENELVKEDDISEIIEHANRDINISLLKDYFAFPSVHSPNVLLSLALGEIKDFADTQIADLIVKALREYKRTQDTGAIDKISDRMYFDRLSDYCNYLNDDIFTKYCAFSADSTNLEILLRSRKMEFDITVFESFLVKGYRISNDELLRIYPGTDAEIIKAYKGTNCEKLSEYIESYSMMNNAAIYARMADEIKTQIMAESKRILFGPSIPLAYLYARQLQAKNINIALTCKRNNLPADISYELLRSPF